jgi:RES domain-containing protein
MRFLWRISNHCDLGGLGGEKASARWHTAAAGKRIVYLAEHPALALLEVLVNLKANPKLLPDRYQLMKVRVEDSVSVETVAPDDLPPTWHDHTSITQAIGDSWLQRRTAALLQVPSAPAPESFNYLLNPLHAGSADVTVEWCRQFHYDSRLFRVTSSA